MDNSEAREFDRMQARVARMSEVSRRMAESRDLETVLREVVDAARLLTDARHGAVGVFDDSGQVRDLTTSGIDLEGESDVGNLPEGQKLLDYLKEIQQPLRLADLAQHPRAIGFPESHGALQSFLGAPIRHLGMPVGAIYLTEKEGGEEFTEQDEETLVMFAVQAAVAIGYDRERRARVEMETERRRLAALVESSPVGVLVVDAATHNFASVNKEAERILGMSPEPGFTLVQFQDVTINRRIDGKAYERHERPIRRALDQLGGFKGPATSRR